MKKTGHLHFASVQAEGSGKRAVDISLECRTIEGYDGAGNVVFSRTIADKGILPLNSHTDFANPKHLLTMMFGLVKYPFQPLLYVKFLNTYIFF